MLDILFLVGAIALLIALQMLRNVLAFVFPTAQSRRVALAKAPDGAADLYAQAHAELGALGFSGPQWHLLRLGDAGDDASHLYAAYTHPEGHVCRLYPLAGLDKPNRLNEVFATRLADGRTAIGQAFDPFFEIIASDRFPSRTLGGATLAQAWQAHRDFIASLGSAVDPAGASDAAIDAFDADVHDGSRARLIAEGKAWIDSRGLARPTLAFAWRMLRAIARRPKAPPNAAPVPPARLAALALMQQRVAERPAPRRMQAGLFAVSVALFLAAGAVFWSASMALILFVVIAIHEFGHYLAMRAFGYRNVQMLALPLVGGVTIGHEAKPDAARRAWMSLMGPLPGVVIGWAMLLALPYLGDAAPSWWMSAAWVFLALNYLNVLPVPPLDGGHVVQALLPAGAAKVQAVFIVVACIAGAIAAYWFGFTLLVMLALFQLTLASSHWQLARLIARARGDAALDPARPRVLRLRRLFEIADDAVGPTPRAAPRIAQATAALASLDLKPMRWLQRGAVGIVYAALLAGPVVAAMLMWSLTRDMPTAAQAAASVERVAQERAAFAAQAAALDIGTLLRARAMDDDATWPPPATDEAIAAAQARLGMTLPDELVALYRLHDGAPAVGFAPLESVVRLRDASDEAVLLSQGSIDVHVFDDDEPVRTQAVGRARAGKWLLLMPYDGAMAIAYDAGEPPAVAGRRMFELFEGGATARESVRAWLEEDWIAGLQSQAFERQRNAGIDAARRELAGLSLPALIERLPRPGLVERVFASHSAPALPSPAAVDAIAAAEARLGAVLPADLRELLAHHDGVPPLRLFAVDRYRRLDLADPAEREAISDRLTARLASGATVETPAGWPASIDEIGTCIAVGGHVQSDTVGLLWCPALDDARRYVDLDSRRMHASLTDHVRDDIARREARLSW